MAKQTSGTTISVILLWVVGFILLGLKKAVASNPIGSGTGGGSVDGNPVDYSRELPGAPDSVTYWHGLVQDVNLDLFQSGQAAVNDFLVLAVIWTESWGSSGARGTSGEIGLMQLMPGTAADFGTPNPSDLYDPYINIKTGIRYLSYCINNTTNTYHALRAYNGGLTGSRANPNLSKSYANLVMNRFNGTSNVDYS